MGSKGMNTCGDHTGEGTGPQVGLPGRDVPRVRGLAIELLGRLPIDGVAVGVRSGPDAAQLVYATDQVIAELDELQFVLGEGPCVDAYQRGIPVFAPDLASHDALVLWPGFAREAEAAGAAAAFAFPLQIGAGPFGTVELYRQAPGLLSGVDVATALLAVDEIIRTVLDELTGGPSGQQDTPQQVLGLVQIPQATGMLAVQLGLTVPEALARLRVRREPARAGPRRGHRCPPGHVRPTPGQTAGKRATSATTG